MGKYSNGIDKIIRISCITLTVIQLVSYISGIFPAMQQRSIFLGFILEIALLMMIQEKLKNHVLDLFGIMLLIGSVAATAYVFFNWETMSYRVVSPGRLDLIMGFFIIASVIYCANKRLGLALPLVAMAFIFYALLGSQIPGNLKTSSFTIQRIVATLTMETSGIFGTILGTASKQIFVFMIFGSFLELSGATQFFLEYVGALLGGLKGSGAKANIMAGILFGTVSGSAVANVMAVGPMTIPMMKRDGFDDEFCGIVSAISGTGGQLMPPVMGTAAFIMAETLSVSYGEVIKAALLPGILFYMALWIATDCRLNHLGIRSKLEKKNSFKILKKGWFYFVPLIFLILTITVMRWSPLKAGMWSTALVVIVSQLNPEKRMNLRMIAKALENSARGAITVSIACAVAGIIVGILSITGLGLKFSTILLAISGGHKLFLMVLTMLAGLVLGMGMTTTSVYIVLSVLVAPALVEFGIYPIAAHLFVFYFGILSCITPPVATAVFASASLLDVSPVKLGISTTKYAIPIYIIPFLFVLNPALLMLEGSAIGVVAALLLCGLTIIALSSSVEGFFCSSYTKVERVVLFAMAMCECSQLVSLKIISNSVIVLILLKNYLSEKRARTMASEL
ncbi:MAG: TRAP transporter fused permease subunit [Lachnospiraceae bacterium]|nr:TRAP transporter fused permease subunit [Lachnospiraceae bacterium]